MNELPKRKQIRLLGHDYSKNGCYFVTICTQNRQCIFGDIINNKMVLNDIGNIIKKNWDILSKRFPVELDEYQIMPNHLHSIIHIVGAGLVPARNRVIANRGETNRATMDRATTRVAPTTLGEIIGAFKSITTIEYINCVKNRHWPLFNNRIWQRNYYEHIIRNENELYKIREYIKLNPEMWERDRNNPNHI